jgi:hypothetical protein
LYPHLSLDCSPWPLPARKQHETIAGWIHSPFKSEARFSKHVVVYIVRSS